MSKQQSGAIDSFSVYPLSIINLVQELSQLTSYLSGRGELNKLLDFDPTSTESNKATHDYHTELTAAFQKDAVGERNCRLLYQNALRTLSKNNDELSKDNDELSKGNDEPLYVFLRKHKDVKECIEKHLPALQKTLDTRVKPSPYGSSLGRTPAPRKPSSSFLNLQDLLSIVPSPPSIESTSPVVKANHAASAADKAIALINVHGDRLLCDLALNQQAIVDCAASTKHRIRYQQGSFSQQKLIEILETFAQLEPATKQRYVDAIHSNDKETLSTFLSEHDAIRKIITNRSDIITELSTNYADRFITHMPSFSLPTATNEPYRPKPIYGVAMLAFEERAATDSTPVSSVPPLKEVMGTVISAFGDSPVRQRVIALITEPGETSAEQAIAALFSPLSTAQKDVWIGALDSYQDTLRPIRSLLTNHEPLTRVLAEHIDNLPRTPPTRQVSAANHEGTVTILSQKLTK